MPTKPHQPGFHPADHDHQRCIDTVMAAADTVCAHNGARLTPLRRRVLEIIWQSHKPLGAYSILDALREDGRTPAPPTVYRSLEFLLEQGLVHRINSLNAFVGCERPGHVGDGQFLICEDCGTATEMHDAKVASAIARSVGTIGFRARHSTVEVSGLCPSCDPGS